MTGQEQESGPRRRLGDQGGFTVIEVLMASVVLVVGALSVFAALNTARALTLVGERQTSLAHRAQQELERLEALTYQQQAMTAAPPAVTGCPSPLTADYPTSPDCFVNGSSFLYDRSNLANSEPLVVDATNGTITPNAAPSGCTDGCTSAWTDGRFSGEIFDFVTWATDPNCGAGTICPATGDYKRLTVIVTMANSQHPAQPLLVSTLVANPDAIPTGAPSNSAQNPLQNPSTQCGGSTCNQALTGTNVDYYLTDTASTASSYTPPTVPNVLHQTLVTVCGLLTCSPNPDQLIATPPTTGGLEPPCFSTDRGCLLTNPTSTGGSSSGTPCNGGTTAVDAQGNCQTGLLLGHPTTDSTSCSSPPADNTKSHSWVTSTIPAGNSITLTGAGGMTAYLESASGVRVNVLLCAALYAEPTGLLGTLTNLLPPNVTQIGATVGVNASVAAAVPTPVSFGFNLGAATTLSSTILSQLRIELVVWLAASAGTDVGVVYDHASASSQLSLVER